MRLSLAAAVVLGASLAACGGDDGAIVPDAELADGPPAAPDAEVPDAEPGPDAMVTADLGCIDDVPLSTGPDPIVISGVAEIAGFSGTDPAIGATAEAFRTGNTTAQDTATTDGTGAFSLTINNDSLLAVDGYVKGALTGYLDSYLYPPFPLSADTDQAPLLFVTNDNLNLLAFVSGATQAANHGFLGIAVLDCAGNPVQGAVVTISPTATETSVTTEVVYLDGMTPNTDLTATSATGVAFVFNAPVGNVVVDASVGGMSLDEHTIEVRVMAATPAVTQTAVAPGPITVTP